MVECGDWGVPWDGADGAVCVWCGHVWGEMWVCRCRGVECAVCAVESTRNRWMDSRTLCLKHRTRHAQAGKKKKPWTPPKNEFARIIE